MNWSIQTSLPLWLIPIGLGLAVLLAWLSYFTPKARKLFPVWARVSLISLRTLSLVLLFLLFLGPKIISRVQTEVKPLFLLAFDNSSSMLNGLSNPDDTIEFANRIGLLEKELENNFDVHPYLFGGRLQEGSTPDYSDKATDFSILFNELASNHFADPVNGLLVVSDGIYNQGRGPLFAADVFPFPIHAWGIGDTTRIPDMRIVEVTANDLVYKDSRFPVEVVYESWNLEEPNPVMRVSTGNKVLLDTIAPFFEGENSGIIRFNLEATETGVQYFRINLSGAGEESNLTNNSYTLAVEVVERKAKVLILAGAPHPDVAAIKSAMAEMTGFETENYSLGEFTGRLNEYDLVIFHQVPGIDNRKSSLIMQEFRRSDVPGWFILGPQSNLGLLNQQNLGLTIGDNSGNIADITGALNNQFSLFKIPPGLEPAMAVWPPLKGPLSTVRTGSRSEILMYQRIKSIKMDYPLFLFTKGREGKNAFLLGEGLWRWRLSEALEYGNNEMLNAIINSLVQYLAIKEDKDQFRLEVPKSLSETEKLIVSAQTYNESYEDLNGMNIVFKLVDSTGQVSNYDIRPSHSGYSLVLDPLKPGRYEYSAETVIGSERFTKKGSFFVIPVNLEELSSTADFTVLQQLAEIKDGQFFAGDQFDQLLSFAAGLKPGDESYRTESKWLDILQVKFLFFLIVFLLTMEWLLRRWFGTR